jgi:aminoglycoside/choline kinase family phosphotransferase
LSKRTNSFFGGDKVPDKLISTRDKMTAEWFTSVLRDAAILDAGHVESVELEHFGGGVMTNMVRAKLAYAGASNAPASVLVKFPSDDEGNLGIAEALGLYELEVHFYQDVAPLLRNTSIPKSYFAALDEKTGRFTLVLEDLSARSKPGTQLDAVTKDHCSAVFRELANFQASLWNSPALTRFDWLDSSRTLRFYDAIPQFLEPFLERFGHALDPDHIKLVETVLPVAGKWIRSWRAPTVLSHGEFRTGNVLFGTAAGSPPVTIIDFQTLLIGPPGIDPAYFMACSLPTEARRKMERDLVTEYHQRLVSAGVERFDWNACWRSYCECALYGVFLYGGTSSQVEPTEENNRMIINLFRGLADMAVDLEAAKLAGLS